MVLLFLGRPFVFDPRGYACRYRYRLLGELSCLPEKVLGQTLNVMTLGGLALSIGVLVDNAIVVYPEVIMTTEART